MKKSVVSLYFKVVLFSLILLAACSAKVSDSTISEHSMTYDYKHEETDDIVKGCSLDDSFYKNLLIRLITDDILIVQGTYEHYYTKHETDNNLKSLSNCKYYIFDIDGDKIFEVGIRYPSGTLITYRYDFESDKLIEFLGRGTYMEVLGDGRILTFSQTALQQSYHYQIINPYGEREIIVSFSREYDGSAEISNEKTNYYKYSMSTIINVSDESMQHKTNTIDITKEQWEIIIELLRKLQEHAPQPLTYEELWRG